MNVPTTWRYQYIKQQIINAYGEHKYNNFYQFGVFTCRSMVDMAKMAQEGNMNIDKFYGFDSFEGLPDDQENMYEIIKAYGIDDWRKGQYSGAEWFGVNNADEALVASRNLLENFIPKDKLVLVKGYWENVLTDELFTEHKMGPALYIDIDGDIYHSALHALDFCFRNGIIQKGTLIGYDDWGTPGFETFATGESRAHKEMFEKYNAKAEPLFQLGNKSPHVQKLFKVI
jgi:hypothetical protein